MSKEKEGRPLKVCQTCRYWSTRYKGLCERLNQGVGRFWICEAWTETEAGPHHLTQAGSQAELGLKK